MNKQQRDYEKAARRNEDGGAGEILFKGPWAYGQRGNRSRQPL